jgi:hypothetical protein
MRASAGRSELGAPCTTGLATSHRRTAYTSCVSARARAPTALRSTLPRSPRIERCGDLFIRLAAIASAGTARVEPLRGNAEAQELLFHLQPRLEIVRCTHQVDARAVSGAALVLPARHCHQSRRRCSRQRSRRGRSNASLSGRWPCPAAISTLSWHRGSGKVEPFRIETRPFSGSIRAYERYPCLQGRLTAKPVGGTCGCACVPPLRASCSEPRSRRFRRALAPILGGNRALTDYPCVRRRVSSSEGCANGARRAVNALQGTSRARRREAPPARSRRRTRPLRS